MGVYTSARVSCRPPRLAARAAPARLVVFETHCSSYFLTPFRFSTGRTVVLMDPRDEAEPDFATVSPYDSIVSRMAALGQEQAGIELARETWTAIQDEKIRSWIETRGGRGGRETTPPDTPPTAPSVPLSTPPPSRRREREQSRERTPGQRGRSPIGRRETASPVSREHRSPDRQRRGHDLPK